MEKKKRMSTEEKLAQQYSKPHKNFFFPLTTGPAKAMSSDATFKWFVQ